MALDVVYRLMEEEVITERESKARTCSLLHRRTIHQPLPDRDIMRARILQAMLLTLIYEQLN